MRQRRILSFVVTELTSERTATVRPLITRYMPECPGNLSNSDMATWIEKHIPFMLATDLGGYRWFVDSLSFAHGVPTLQFRGRLQRDSDKIICDPFTGQCKLR